MTMVYSVHEAKTHLSRLLDQMERGDEVVIQRHGRPVARLVPAKPPKRKIQWGAMKGQLTVPDNWDSEEVNREIAEEFEGR